MYDGRDWGILIYVLSAGGIKEGLCHYGEPRLSHVPAHTPQAHECLLLCNRCGTKIKSYAGWFSIEYDDATTNGEETVAD